MIPIRGTLDYRCFLGASWRIDFPASELGDTIEPFRQRHDGFEAPLAADVSSPTRRHSPAISAPITRPSTLFAHRREQHSELPAAARYERPDLGALGQRPCCPVDMICELTSGRAVGEAPLRLLPCVDGMGVAARNAPP
jgi:hypothetical protein